MMHACLYIINMWDALGPASIRCCLLPQVGCLQAPFPGSRAYCSTIKMSLQEFGVNGYPTLKYFGENKRRPLAYSGARDADAMADFALAKWAALQPPPEVRQQEHTCWRVAALLHASLSMFPQHSHDRPSCSVCRCKVANTHECVRGTVAHCPADEMGTNVLLHVLIKTGWTQPVCGLALPYLAPPVSGCEALRRSGSWGARAQWRTSAWAMGRGLPRSCGALPATVPPPCDAHACGSCKCCASPRRHAAAHAHVAGPSPAGRRTCTACWHLC